MATRLAIETFHPRSPLASLFWRFPHEIRRLLYSVVFPRNAYRFSRLRKADGNAYALHTFDRLRCVYIHIPKTAGMSISQSLFGAEMALHKTILDYQIILSKDKFDTYFKFAFVRNPWDRIVSAYAFLERGGYNERHKKFWDNVISPYGSFDGFITKWMNPDTIFSHEIFVPQYVYMCGSDGESKLDYLGRFESLDRDFEFVANRLGMQTKLARKNITVGRKAHYREYYTEGSRKVIEDLYARDIQMLGYLFEG